MGDAAELRVSSSFTGEERALLERMEAALDARMEAARKRRVHSLGVARTSVELARVYGVEPFEAACAGLLHDWDKVLGNEDIVARACTAGIEIAGSPHLAAPLLHGPVAARDLPEVFPELSPSALQAIARHTLGACDMTPLDMVVFIADAIEPGRHGSYAEDLRARVGTSSLRDLFVATFSQGLVYVIQSGRYLYPSALTIYNHYALGLDA